MARRLVGFYEYGNALADLDKLVGLASEDDMEVIDEIIADRHEFDVFLALPDSFTPETSSEVKVIKPAKASQVTGNEFRQSGLAWVTALARVELGAMLAAFTEFPSPFKDVTPESFDYRNAMQLLLEGVTGHYRGLSTSTKVKEKDKNVAVENALTLSRRVRMARAMLAPLLAPGASEYNPAQAYELGEYHSDLEEGQKLAYDQIRELLADQRQISQSTSNSSLLNACGAQLAAEQRELAAGTATVTHFPSE